MTTGIQQSEKCWCLKNCRIQATTVVFLLGTAPIPSHLPTPSSMGMKVLQLRAGPEEGQKMCTVEGSSYHLGSKECDGELTNSVVCKQEGPEALLVWSCGHGCSKHTLGWRCVNAQQRPKKYELAKYSWSTLRLWAYAKETWKDSAKSTSGERLKMAWTSNVLPNTYTNSPGRGWES